MTSLISRYLLSIFIIGLLAAPSSADESPELVKSIETTMEIPDIRTIASSQSHMYILSGREGLIVFRTTADSLQWLYSSSGLADRGNRLVADSRFAYLFGDNGRLTVIEPTSVLGVYSSTHLESDPNDLVRIGNSLFMADDRQGIRKLSLESSESVDQTPLQIHQHDEPMVSLARISDRLFALDQQNRLFFFEYTDGELIHERDVAMPDHNGRLHTIAHRLYMTTDTGTVYRIRSDGRYDELFQIDNAVTQLESWNDTYVIRDQSNLVWIAGQGFRPAAFRQDSSAGNHITTFKDQLWISEFREVTRWLDARNMATFSPDTPPDESTDPRVVDTPDEPLRIQHIEKQIIPYPRPLLLTLNLDSGHHPENVRFQQRSHIDGIRIRGNGFYWQPSSSDVGTHIISLIATSRGGQTDSTSFEVTVRPFNSPPRFSPVRTLSIPIGESFSIPFHASDPDGRSADLIRYIGVDLPDGASLDERSGEFEWTPNRRQSGEHDFQIIATDQYGAASSLDVKIEVIDLNHGES